MTTRTPACTTKGCPAPKDPDWHRCWCGNDRIEHHHVESRGMGGSKIKKNIVALCHGHHEAVTLHKCYDIVTDFGWAKRYFYMDTNGETLHTRVLEADSAAAEAGGADGEARPTGRPTGPAGDVHRGTGSAAAPSASGEHSAAEAGQPSQRLVLRPETGKQGSSAAPSSVLTEDWSELADEDLEVKFRSADQMQGVAFLLKCKAVNTFREKHVQAWGQTWTEEAYKRFHVSRRTLYAYGNIWEISATLLHEFEHLSALSDSRSLMAYIGQKSVEDGQVAMEAAVAHLAEYGEPPTPAALAHRLGEERGERTKVSRMSYQELEAHLCDGCRASVLAAMEAK